MYGDFGSDGENEKGSEGIYGGEKRRGEN